MASDVDTALAPFGWTPEVAARFAEGDWSDAEPGRVVRIDRGRARVQLPSGVFRPYTGRHEIAVGDWVAVDTTPASERLVGVTTRHSAIRRQAAGDEQRGQLLVANVDLVFLVTPVDQPLNPRRLERALTLVWSSGASPVVVLSKADLCSDVATAITAAQEVALEAPIVVTSTITGEGLDQLRSATDPTADGEVRTVALLGASGAGKSKLVNVLLGDERMATGEVRASDRKGRHTTTHRELVRMPSGGLLIDTPGLRSLGLWDASEGLDVAFADVLNLAEGCRFADCRHRTEPGCSVVEATATGELSPDRLQAWLALQTERAALEARLQRASWRRRS